MKRLRIIAGVLFLAALAATVIAFNASKPRLLILHSYDKDYSWTRDVDVGLKRGLHGNRDISVRWFYMDSKRHPWKEFKVNAGRAAQKVVRTWQPNVVIAIDDDAQEFAMRYFANQPQVSIVYAGVNGEPQQYGYTHAQNVTGILERKPWQALKETLLQIAGPRAAAKPVRILFLGDASESVRQDAQAFSQFDWQPLRVVGQVLAKTYAEWQQAVRSADPAQVDFIITSNYRMLALQNGEKALAAPKEVVRWTEAHARMPVIGSNAFFVEDGGMLAVATSPYEQGEAAVALAMQILRKGALPSSLPVQSTQQFVIAMQASHLQRRGIRLPAVYEAAARASANYYP